LNFKDLSSGASNTFEVAYAKGEAFAQAEWTQEDPEDTPYPAVSVPHFQKVEVNDRVPRLAVADGSALLASNGRDWVPTPFSRDGFSLVRPTGYGREYLADAAPADRAWSAFTAAYATWGATPASARASAVNALAASYLRFSAALSRQRWPSRAGHDIALSVQADNSAVANLRAWARSGYASTSPHAAQVRQDQAVVHKASVQLCALLGLPPP
jgi:hypothetical protein